MPSWKTTDYVEKELIVTDVIMKPLKGTCFTCQSELIFVIFNVLTRHDIFINKI